MGITRRTFLMAVGVGATAAACSTTTTGSGAPTPVSSPSPASSLSSLPPLSPPVTTASVPGPIDHPALARQLTGTLLTPDSPGYALARRSYNPLYDGRRPAAVALCARTEDVQECVAAAVRSNTPLAARSGGHSYAGFSTPDNALVVDLAGMSGVRVNSDGTAVVGAGARLIDVYAALAAAGRCLPAGSCPSVGVAGLTLGGGIGVLSRKYGLTADHLVGATVVTADGAARTVSASSEPNLFWALRGGGGGNFGIVTSFTFTTMPAPRLAVFQLAYPAGAVADAYGPWQDWLRAAPDELWTNFNVTGGSAPTATIAGCYVGTPSGLNQRLNSLIGRIGAQPVRRTVLAKSYLGAMRYFAGCAGRSMATCQAETHGPAWHRESFVASSRMLAAPVKDPARLVSVAKNHPNLHVIVDGLGGAVGRVAVGATAFPHRTAVASVQLYLKTTAAAQHVAAQQVVAARNALTPLTGEGAYVNYIDATMPNWARAYYGTNLPRLRQVAQHYDPDRVFTFPQAVTRA
jgi:FAD/FMN-containing dehydrogenase